MPRYYDEPNMSDTTILCTVEDLINRALGPPDGNIVNFKLIQTILHIIARQQRILEQRVEINVTDLRDERPKAKKARESSTSSSSKGPSSPRRHRMADIKEEHDKVQLEVVEKEGVKDKGKIVKPEKKDKVDKEQREKEKAELLEKKLKEKAEQLAKKEKEKLEKLEIKEREKADLLGKKEKEKAEKIERKEREKAEKLDRKEKEKAEKLEMKEKEKVEKLEMKEKEKAEKMGIKEKEKAMKELERSEKAAQKEQERREKEAKKEQERAEKEKARLEKERERSEREKSPKSAKEGKKKVAKVASTTSLEITEKERGKEKVLVVEKGPTTRTDAYGRGNIEIVTQSQFALLEAAVNELKGVAAPKQLQFPDNVKLKSDLVKGTASLPDSMQTLQVDARVKAAENAIHRMTGLLTQLAAAGALPEDIASDVEKVRVDEQAEFSDAPIPPETTKSRPSIAPRKSVVIDPKATQSQASRMEAKPSAVASSSPLTTRVSIAPTARPSLVSKVSVTTTEGPSLGSKPSQSLTARPSISRASSASIPQAVTYGEMNAALKGLRDDISKDLQNMTMRATTAAETALHTAKSVADRLDVVLKLDTRISALYSLVEDYGEQLSGFDSGLTTQMQSFQDQMAQMRSDLKSGLAQLENVNNNAETAAVMELTERYEELATELDATLHAHKSLTALQTQLTDEMHSLVECVEMLREQKSDRDEVLDGLRDKADSSRLAGLLTEAEFAEARADFERRIDLCHDKFRRQDAVWTAAVRDLNNLTDKKAEIVELLSARDETQRQLQDLYERTKILAAILGEPKAAMLTRKLAVDATCGICKVSALMDPRDAVAGAPARLPALRPPPVGAPGEPCIADWVGTEPPQDRHVCHRWCGGSHTLISEATKREQAPCAQLQTVPTKKYTDYGSDGRLYMLEEELQPCVECNVLSKDIQQDKEPDGGAGDREPEAQPSMTCTCPLLQ